MTTLDNIILDAWQSREPFALDQVAIKWAAEGRSKTSLYDALERLLLSMRDAGAGEESEERILGVMDRLTGWCHESNFIATKGGEPLDDAEFAVLPRWANVAFASRCARRALPVFVQKWPDAPEELLTALKYATEVGEWLASRGGEKGESGISLLAAVTCAYFVCDAAYNADRNRGRARQVIRGIGKVIAVLDVYPEDAAGDIYRVIAKTAALAMADGIATNRDNYPFAVEYARSLVRGDLDSVTHLCRQNQWNDMTPVPPNSFGPLTFEEMPAAWSRLDLSTAAPTYSSLNSASLIRLGINILDMMNRYFSSNGEDPILLDNAVQSIHEQLTVAV